MSWELRGISSISAWFLDRYESSKLKSQQANGILRQPPVAMVRPPHEVVPQLQRLQGPASAVCNYLDMAMRGQFMVDSKSQVADVVGAVGV
jgi:hypothetical protein